MSLPIVGVDGISLRVGVLSDKIVKGLAVKTVDDLEACLAATLDDPNDNTLIASVTVADAFPFTTHQGFVNLDLTTQLGRIELSHCGSDAVTEIPRSFIRDPDGALDLIGRDTLFGLQHQIDGDEPLGKRKMAVVEDGASRHRELVAA